MKNVLLIAMLAGICCVVGAAQAFIFHGGGSPGAVTLLKTDAGLNLTSDSGVQLTPQ